VQIIYTPKAKEHLEYWVKTGNKSILKKIIRLTKAIIDNPYEGIGKPEPLIHELTGYWSRRITLEHRFVFAIAENTLIVASLKGHY
jgi:toxin YoeB